VVDLIQKLEAKRLIAFGWAGGFTEWIEHPDMTTPEPFTEDIVDGSKLQRQ